MKKFIQAIVFCLAGISMAAQAADSRVVELWHCELEEGATMEQVAAANGKWLTFVNNTVEDGEIRSYAMESIVGESGPFVFVDTFPGKMAWATAKEALETPEGKAVEAGFKGLWKCSKNRLYKSTQHMPG